MNTNIRYEKGGLLAPNGKESNLTSEQYKLVRTPQFKAFFGDWENDPANSSKVVDENGEPLVVYHRSKKIFYEFDREKQLNGWLGKGFYFSDNKLEFKEYGNKLLSVFLNVRKPFIVKGESPTDFLYELKKMFDTDKFDTTQTLKDNKYDGVIYKHWDYQGKMFSCFIPNQIKLADGSNTTFDMNNPDIRYKDGGEIKTEYSVIDKILDQAKPFIEELVENNKKYWIEKDKPLSELDIEYLRLELVRNLVKALSNYVDKNDTVKENIYFKKSKGVVSIICTIVRDNKEYYFSTEMIIAGGYNIQALHYRYIVDTKLPRIDNSTALNPIKEKVKKLKEQEKIAKEIETYNNWIKQTENKIENGKHKTKEQVFAESYYKDWNWEQGRFRVSKEEFEKKLIEIKKDVWETHLREQEYQKNRLIQLQKDLAKYKQKKGVLQQGGSLDCGSNHTMEKGGSIGVDVKKVSEALIDVDKAPSVKYWMQPEFKSETYKYPQESEPNSFLKTEKRGTLSSGGKWQSDDIVAYDANGKIIGSFSIAKEGKEKGAFKIVVREDAQRQGWGKKVLDEAERQGIDVVGNIGKNSFTSSGRDLLRNWLQGKLKDITNKKEYSTGGFNHTMEQGGEILFAPNGKQSNLTPEQYKLVRTPQFKAWFGDWENYPANASKVVDENGEPLVCNHSSRERNIDVFYGGRIFRTKKNEVKPIWFTYKEFNEYASGDDIFQYQCFLNIKNIFDYTKIEDVNKLKKSYIQKNGEMLPDYDFDMDWDAQEQFNLPAYISEMGYDGYKFTDEYSVVVFNSNQIKLADGSNTTFDMNNPDIRYADGGEVDDLGEIFVIKNKLKSGVELLEAYMVVDKTNPFVLQFKNRAIYCLKFSKNKDGKWHFYNVAVGFTKEEFKEIKEKSLKPTLQNSSIIIGAEKKILYELMKYEIDYLISKGFVLSPLFVDKYGVTYSVDKIDDDFYTINESFVKRGKSVENNNSLDIYATLGGDVFKAINNLYKKAKEEKEMAKGGEIAEHEETYKKWKSLVNMSKSELENFYNSKEGKEAGLSSSEAKELGIHSGRESARWIMKMKDVPHQDWTPKMWEWANRQISFISRMSGNKGGLYDDKGNKTRKHTSLLIWGHNPKKYEGGGSVGVDVKVPNQLNVNTDRIRKGTTNSIEFSKPIIGKNGSKLLSYTWESKDFGKDKFGKPIRFSDWEKAGVNADTGRNIVHKFKVEVDGKVLEVSADSVAKALGFTDAEMEKVFPKAKDFVKQLANMKMREQALVNELENTNEAVANAVKKVSDKYGVKIDVYKEGDKVIASSLGMPKDDVMIGNDSASYFVKQELREQGIYFTERQKVGIELNRVNNLIKNKIKQSSQFGGLNFFEPKAVEQSLKETTKAGSVGVGGDVKSDELVVKKIADKEIKRQLDEQGYETKNKTAKELRDLYKKEIGTDEYKEPPRNNYKLKVVSKKQVGGSDIRLGANSSDRSIRNNTEKYGEPTFYDKTNEYVWKTNTLTLWEMEDVETGKKYSVFGNKEYPFSDIEQGQPPNYGYIEKPKFNNGDIFEVSANPEINEKYGNTTLKNVRKQAQAKAVEQSLKETPKAGSVGVGGEPKDITNELNKQTFDVGDKVTVRGKEYTVYKPQEGRFVYLETPRGAKKILKVDSNILVKDDKFQTSEEKFLWNKGDVIHTKQSLKETPKVYESGGTISQTPAPKEDKVYGSKVNAKGSSKDTESAKEIKFDAKTLLSINDKVREHNKQHPNKKITLASAKAVVRRGMGAYSSTHRPTISGGKPNSRVAWGLARLNAFMYKIIHGKSKSGKYKQDDDLINELGYSVKSYSSGGRITPSRSKIPNVRGGWTKDKILRYLKEYSSDTTSTYTLEKFISEFDNWQQLKDHLYYHGTPNYIEKGLKPSIAFSERFAENQGGGGYGERYWGISLTKRKRTAETFSGISDGVTVYPVFLKRDANVIDRLDIQDSSEIEDIIVELYEDNVDAVWIGGGEEELVVVNPESILLYKKGSESYRVLGGFKSKPLTDEEIKKIYDESKELWESYSAEYSKKTNKDEKNEFLDSIKPIQFKGGGTVEKLRAEEQEEYQNMSNPKDEIKRKQIYDKYDKLITPLMKQLAPNGKPSNLTPEQYKLVRTNAFKKWFGDWEKLANAKINDSGIDEVTLENLSKGVSKIVDENGEPLVVYHGTDNEWNVFDLSKIGEGSDFLGKGIYLTENINVAKFYANKVAQNRFIIRYEEGILGSENAVYEKDAEEKAKKYEVIYSFFVNAKSVLNLYTAKIDKEIEQIVIQELSVGDTLDFATSYWNSIVPSIAKYKERTDYQGDIIYVINRIPEAKNSIIEYLKSKYDGFIFQPKITFEKQDVKYNNLVVFKSNQIKLADGTNTTFDAENNDIRYEQGGLIAPNGKQSNLTPEQYKLVRTPQFKSWFGDWENDPENASKVVDENGEPLVLNHSTRKNQKEDGSYEDYFDVDSWLQESGNYLFSTPNSSVNPIFLSRKGEYALSDDIWQIKFFANIKNLFDTDNKNHLKKLQDYTIKTYSKYGDYNEMVEDLYGGGYETFEVDYKIGEKRNKWENSGSIPALINEMGYDAYINNDENVIVVFDRNKLKLADGSNTTFDSDNADIRYESGGLIAPNGKPSNLTPEQYKLVRTPQFKAWFGDWENDPANASKVVDENGEPLVVYHGSSYGGINIFDIRESKRQGDGLKEYGTYFTNNKKLADFYHTKGKLKKEAIDEIDRMIYKLEFQLDSVKNNRDFDYILKEIDKLEQIKKGKVYPVFLNLRKIKEFDAKGKEEMKGWYELKVDAGYKIANNRDAMDFLKNGKFGVEKVDGVVAKNIIDAFVQGDPFLSKELISDVYLVFNENENNIKLADGTNTSFDMNNPDIRYKEGGEVKLNKIILYHEKQGNFLIPKGEIYAWLYDDTTAAQKMNSGEWDFIMFPMTSMSAAFQRGYIPPLLRIWDKKFQKDKKGIEHLLGIVKAFYDEKDGKLYIDMMTTNPKHRREGINSHIIKQLREEFNLSQDDIIFDKPTEMGKKFMASKTYEDGGLVSFNKKMKDEWIPMWKIDYGEDATDELINEMVARHYLYDLGYKYYGGVDEIDFLNKSLNPKNHFQMKMYLGDVSLMTNPFIYVDDNHKIVLKRTKVEVLNSDTYETVKKDIKLELGGIFKSHKNIEQIAKEKNVSLPYAKIKLKKGMKIESEHSNNKKVQEIIALQHLDENIKYYDKIK